MTEFIWGDEQKYIMGSIRPHNICCDLGIWVNVSNLGPDLGLAPEVEGDNNCICSRIPFCDPLF
jgi:hypothetical protein